MECMGGGGRCREEEGEALHHTYNTISVPCSSVSVVCVCLWWVVVCVCEYVCLCLRGGGLCLCRCVRDVPPGS